MNIAIEINRIDVNGKRKKKIKNKMKWKNKKGKEKTKEKGVCSVDVRWNTVESHLEWLTNTRMNYMISKFSTNISTLKWSLKIKYERFDKIDVQGIHSTTWKLHKYTIEVRIS